MALKKIPIHKLKPGMFVGELDRSWLNTPFLFHSVQIKTQKQIDKLLHGGIQDVIIDTDKGIDLEEHAVLSQSEKDHLTNKQDAKKSDSVQSIFVDPVLLKDELPRAKEIKQNVSTAVKSVFNDARMGKAMGLSDVKDQVNNIVDSVFRNRDALLCLASLKDYDNYTFVHSVNVSILAVSFGRQLNLSKSQLMNIGLGGLLHDIGKTQIPESILNKPGKYTVEEYNIMKRHVSLGVELLNKHDNIPHDAMLFTAQHHERYNGTGYPQRLYGEKISLIGRIGSISDVYDAITYDRVYHKASSCHGTVKRLYEWSDTLFDKDLIEKFIQCIGIYPFGSFVEMNTGHCGIVVSVNHENLLKPNILLLFDKNKKPQTPVLVDPASDVDDKGNCLYSIVKELNPAEWNIDVNQYI
ncbi:MAG: HD-GYP domain-containing protein [Nitrospirae bacterium]|nr:HD-GYP domain-containing protein [Nitrospirota bacterium]